MPQVNLTDLAIHNLAAPTAGQVTYWDKGLAGFGVRVSQGGTKTFTLVHGEQRSRLTIGRYPIISLKDARAEAKRILAKRTLETHRGPSIKFDDALELFYTTHCARLKPRTVKDNKRILNKHFLPKLRTELLENITPHHIDQIVDKLVSTPMEANHAFSVGRTFFRFAVKRHYLAHSPCEGMSLPFKPGARDRVLSDKEIAALYRAATDYPFGTIVRLLILTGQRRGEVAALKWSYIDKRRKTITLPASITKNNRQHTFPYGKMAAALLSKLDEDGEYLFPARGKPEHAFTGWSKCKLALDETSHIAPWTLHDLRRTFATKLAELRVPVHVAEKLLNHTSGTLGGIVAVYNRHAYESEMREAITAWETHLRALLRRK